LYTTSVELFTVLTPWLPRRLAMIIKLRHNMTTEHVASVHGVNGIGLITNGTLAITYSKLA